MADDGLGRPALGIAQMPQIFGHGRQTQAVPCAGAGEPLAGQVRRDDMMIARQQRQHAAPALIGPPRAVQQQNTRSLPRLLDMPAVRCDGMEP